MWRSLVCMVELAWFRFIGCFGGLLIRVFTPTFARHGVGDFGDLGFWFWLL